MSICRLLFPSSHTPSAILQILRVAQDDTCGHMAWELRCAFVDNKGEMDKPVMFEIERVTGKTKSTGRASTLRGSSRRVKRRGEIRPITEETDRERTEKVEDGMSGKNKIYISEFDMKRLKGLINFAEKRWDKRVVQHLKELDEELDRAEVVKPEQIPHDVITMNSTFRVSDVDSGEEVVYTLVFPGKADRATGKISILAPIGTAVLGYRVGDTLEWKVPAGWKRLKVKEVVYQPEAAGDYCS
jgi:regulator of nucleoside diphosphate kinase